MIPVFTIPTPQQQHPCAFLPGNGWFSLGFEHFDLLRRWNVHDLIHQLSSGHREVLLRCTIERIHSPLWYSSQSEKASFYGRFLQFRKFNMQLHCLVGGFVRCAVWYYQLRKTWKCYSNWSGIRDESIKHWGFFHIRGDWRNHQSMSFTETRMPWFWGLFAGFAHFPKSLCNLYMYVFGFMFLNLFCLMLNWITQYQHLRNDHIMVHLCYHFCWFCSTSTMKSMPSGRSCGMKISNQVFIMLLRSQSKLAFLWFD